MGQDFQFPPSQRDSRCVGLSKSVFVHLRPNALVFSFSVHPARLTSKRTRRCWTAIWIVPTLPSAPVC